jgi:hypothetical protein
LLREPRRPKLAALEYWIARSSRVKKALRALAGRRRGGWNQKGEPLPAAFAQIRRLGARAERGSTRAVKNYFFFLALDFFAFFAFFAFLAIVSSQSLMD